MTFEKLEKRKGIEGNQKLSKAYNKIQRLLAALSKKPVPVHELTAINEQIIMINSLEVSEKELTKSLKKTHSYILKFVGEKLNFVSKNHYLNLWAGFGILAGVVLSTTFGNDGFMGIGISEGIAVSLGMLVGVLIGTKKDMQAKMEGKQLELEIE